MMRFWITALLLLSACATGAESETDAVLSTVTPPPCVSPEAIAGLSAACAVQLGESAAAHPCSLNAPLPSGCAFLAMVAPLTCDDGAAANVACCPAEAP